ncbi:MULTISPECIES: LPS translocon maturation chaperone LptM [Cellvibrio]|jgi:predicted small lipoprotein YifL|uniref:Small lipoprotein YifL n=1 Tax=Cellvibrio fibrivorans TaxID=126350 RepID=A0ABU1UT73_9GAMM|nr:lipoprotein [Cellvibrio fibrivorans]MDR7088376.1 putative small lipoprotein YifL [Cellvibrio fibrivorans]
MKIAVVLMLLCLGLGACGQKGPLYLPQPNKPQPEAPAPQTEPAQPKADQPKTNQPETPAE